MIRYPHCDQLTHALQERVVTMAILLLGLAIFIAFWNRDAWPIYSSGSPQDSGHVKLGFSTSFGLQPEGLLQWALGKSNDRQEYYVPAQPRESLNDDNDVHDHDDI
jgi:hypothetical protein